MNRRNVFGKLLGGVVGSFAVLFGGKMARSNEKKGDLSSPEPLRDTLPSHCPKCKKILHVRSFNMGYCPFCKAEVFAILNRNKQGEIPRDEIRAYLQGRASWEDTKHCFTAHLFCCKTGECIWREGVHGVYDEEGNKL